jgi:hypothetical protein
MASRGQAVRGLALVEPHPVLGQAHPGERPQGLETLGDVAQLPAQQRGIDRAQPRPSRPRNAWMARRCALAASPYARSAARQVVRLNLGATHLLAGKHQEAAQEARAVLAKVSESLDALVFRADAAVHVMTKPRDGVSSLLHR